MNKRLLGVLLFALIVSAGATLVLYRMIASRVAAQAAPPSTHLLVATRDLALGTLVKESDLQEIEWPGAVPAQAITKTEDVLERGVISPIYAGEPFLQTRLAPKGAGAGLAATIPPGKRAVAIRVNDITSVAGFVTPGMRVDVLILGTPPSGSQALGTQTKTLLQNMEVLSAGQQIERDREGKPVSVPVVNMLVTPEQAEVLSLASQDARIQLVLRNPMDTEEAKTQGTAMASLWTGQRPTKPAPSVNAVKPRPAAVPVPVLEPPKPTPPKPLPPIIVQIIHGANKTEAKFAQKEKESEEK
jgi:pilus assembly protein CpaB